MAFNLKNLEQMPRSTTGNNFKYVTDDDRYAVSQAGYFDLASVTLNNPGNATINCLCPNHSFVAIVSSDGDCLVKLADRTYQYFTADTIADVTASGYFAGKNYSFDADESIKVQAADGPYEVQLVGGVASVVYSGLNKVQSRIVEATKSESPYTFIVTGDSTRDNVNGRTLVQYRERLAKLNFEVWDNASAGQSVYDWANNVDATTVQQAIDNTPSDGETTIMEFSLGLNDYTDGSPANAASIKSDILYGLGVYMAAKPKALVYLVSPVASARDEIYESMFAEIASELGLTLISGYDATVDVQGDSTYYADDTHPNVYGSIRLVNYIFSNLLPNQVKHLTPITDAKAVGLPLPRVEVQTGYWTTSGGVATLDTDSSWRSTKLIPVDPASVVDFTHQGNQTDYFMFDIDGNFVKRGADNTAVQTNSLTYFIAFNITDDGTTYDALSDVPVIRYTDGYAYPDYIKQDAINEGLKVSLPYVPTQGVDDLGNVGYHGQNLTTNASGNRVWEYSARFFSLFTRTSSEYITLNSTITLTGDFKIGFKYKLSSLANNLTVCSSTGTEFLRFNAGSSQMSYRIGGTVYTISAYDEDTNLNYMEFERKGTTVTLTRNGVVIDSRTVAVADFPISFIGKRDATDYFNGYIADFTVWDNQVPVSRFRLDEDYTSETVVVDSVDFANGGTLNNLSASKLFMMVSKGWAASDGTMIDSNI